MRLYEDAISALCAMHGIRRADLLGGRRTTSCVRARRMLCALLRASRRYSRVDIADLIGVDPSTTTGLLAGHEKRMRDDARYYRDYMAIAHAIDLDLDGK